MTKKNVFASTLQRVFFRALRKTDRSHFMLTNLYCHLSVKTRKVRLSSKKLTKYFFLYLGKSFELPSVRGKTSFFTVVMTSGRTSSKMKEDDRPSSELWSFRWRGRDSSRESNNTHCRSGFHYGIRSMPSTNTNGELTIKPHSSLQTCF